jgi:alkylation response protein AidB-like acyl-CoA dehydrogenase
MNFEMSARAKETLERVQAFMKAHIEPIEVELWQTAQRQRRGGEHTTWEVPPVVEELKAKAKAEGLWNLFLSDAQLGAGLSVLEYAPIAEQTGRSLLAPTVFNCNAPDTGNMEVLYHYGSDAQKKTWMAPLLDGKIRSVFAMTEPDVASSDATNMRATAIIDGDDVVVNGKKWWTTGLGHPDAKVAIVMAHTPDPSKDRHGQHSMVLVPLDTPGVKIVRMLAVFGEYDEPYGHGEVHFDDVRVPIANFVAGPGRGFEIAQGRLGPGRIHHSMRCIGAAELALDLMIERGMKRVAFGKPLLNLGGNRERVAEARMAIDQARLLTLYAAWKIDKVGAMGAMTEISAIKVVAPNVLQMVADMAIQIHGGAGLSNDTPLAALFTMGRALRIVDGPDEVHKGVIARVELMKRGYSK